MAAAFRVKLYVCSVILFNTATMKATKMTKAVRYSRYTGERLPQAYRPEKIGCAERKRSVSVHRDSGHAGSNEVKRLWIDAIF
jgi:hypothetical protein